MFDSVSYMNRLIALLQQAFGDRLIYVGLQGSYLRGEAHEGSDIDPMVVINELTRSDLDICRQIVNQLDHPEKSCGFYCGLSELLHWSPLEICHVMHTTQDWFGHLAELVPGYTETDVRRYLQMSIGNLYHELCHRYLHADEAKNRSRLPGSSKSLFYILQNLYYLKTGIFAPTHAVLLPLLDATDRAVLELSLQLRSAGDYDFQAAFDTLLNWCQQTLASL